MDLDDLIQEGYVCYAICRARYDQRVENQRHFMALVKACFMNQITDLANQRTAEPEIAVSQLGDEENETSLFESAIGGMDGDAEFAALLSSAPPEIRKLLQLASSPGWDSLMDAPLARHEDGTRETSLERITRALNLPQDGLDIEERLRRFLAGLDPNPQMKLIPHPARGAIR
jgi:hypothetical protein